MLLAEALNERKRLIKAAGEWRDRAVARAVRDEDEVDTTADLIGAMAKMDDGLMDWQEITRKIYARNATATLADGSTMLDAILLRDVLIHRHQHLSAVLAAAEPGGKSRDRYFGGDRRSKDDVKQVVQADASALLAKVNSVAERIRLLDIEIQKVNWTVEL
jgi:hypothetical protein